MQRPLFVFAWKLVLQYLILCFVELIARRVTAAQLESRVDAR